MGSGSGPRGPQHTSRVQDAAAAHGAEHQMAGSFGGYSSKPSAAGEEGPMVMASATNRKPEAEPLTVEKGQLEKAAALCVEKPVDAISVAGDKAPAATGAGDKAPAATEAGDKAPAATGAGDEAPPATVAGDEAQAARVAGDEAPAESGDEAPAARESSDKAPATREGLTPLPKEEVERVLSWKRGKLTSIYSTPEAIEVFEALSDSCAEYQAWMRAEYEANNGVVWVDDEFLREQAESIQSLKDFWKDEMEDDDDFDFTGWHFEGDVDSPGWNIPRPSH